MCRNWHVEEEVTVVYPNGRVRNGTLTQITSKGYTVLFFEEGDLPEQADPHVQERWLRAPGTGMTLRGPRL